jgi:hypothetical protein
MAYDYITYADNWSYYPNLKYPAIPSGVHCATAFCVVNMDGNFDVRYPLTVVTNAQGINPASTYLALGGWNNSNLDPSGLQNAGLYNILRNRAGSYVDPTSKLTGPLRMLINSLFVVTLPKGQSWTEVDLPYNPNGDPELHPRIDSGLGFTCIIMDYEGFGSEETTPTQIALLTQFMSELSNKLSKNTAEVQMALPGYIDNQQKYTDLTGLRAITPSIKFHLMLYDYAASLAKVVVTPNASITMTYDALNQYPTTYPNIDFSQFYIGFPNYGRGFVVDKGLTAADVQTKIPSNGFSSVRVAIWSDDADFDNTGLIADDAIISKVSSWDAPTGGWLLATVASSSKSTPTVTFNDYYYYQPTTGILINAFPDGTTVSSVQDLATMIAQFSTKFGKFCGFMSWEAQQNFTGSKMTSLMSKTNT